MLSRKTIFVLVICFGIVVSVYFVSKKSNLISDIQNNTITSDSYINIKNKNNDDWEKALSKINIASSTTIILTKNDPNSFDGTTVTAQVSRDLLSRYLSATKNGQLTIEESTKIAENTLSNPEYTSISAIKYTTNNLNILSKSDSKTLQEYENNMISLLREKIFQVKENPVIAFREAVINSDETKITKLDPIILLTKNLITELVNFKVPEKAAGVHLDLLNNVSNLLADLEAMRVVFIDPVKSLSGVQKYISDLYNFNTAINKLDTFFKQN